MTKKYKLLKNKTMQYKGITLYRIQALKDFGDVKAGNIGGYVESEHNLYQRTKCWVDDNAKVFGKAKVYKDAKIYGNAEIFGNAKIYEKAEVFGSSKIFEKANVYGRSKVYENAMIYGNAKVYDSVMVYGNAKVYGNAIIYGDSEIFEKAKIYEDAVIHGDSKIFGKAKIYGDTMVYRDAKVYENAKVYWRAIIGYNKLTKDIKEDLVAYIYASMNVLPIDGKYTLYKKVNKISEGVYASVYDRDFIYKDGKIAKAIRPDKAFHISCGSGLHASTTNYPFDGDTQIKVEVELKDIITCMAGKVRCKRLKVIGEVK